LLARRHFGLASEEATIGRPQFGFTRCLQSAITEAVKKADPDCEAFVGVIVQRETPKARLDANWAIRGVRYGEKCSKALTTIVERMQREFNLAPHVPGSTDKTWQLKSDV
jgi:hypothetical protein